jgi:hypothetical protein
MGEPKHQQVALQFHMVCICMRIRTARDPTLNSNAFPTGALFVLGRKNFDALGENESAYLTMGILLRVDNIPAFG